MEYYESKFFIGLDLGQSQDYTAIAILEKKSPTPSIMHLRHLERVPLGTSYPGVVARVKELYDDPELDHPKIITDKSGVGAAVCDLINQAEMYQERITIIGGDTVVEGEYHEWRVPKRDLVAVLKVARQTDRLKFAEDIPEKQALAREMGAFQYKLTDSANDIYAAREGEHDDLILAIALACWWADVKSDTNDWFWSGNGAGGDDDGDD